MILCFSGTGNSRRVADSLHEVLGDSVVRLSPGQMRSPEKVRVDVNDGRVIWVLPIHAWGMPKEVKKIIRASSFSSDMPVSHYLVCTCGDDVGMADKIWRRLIGARSWKAVSAFSVQMPNSYVFLPGFDVDSPELADAKLAAMPERVEAIADAIEADSGTVVTDVARGAWPRFKSYVLRPLFMALLSSPGWFRSSDACIGCGKCARNCPLNVISMGPHRPKWSGPCTMCLRCYHCCPAHAIDYMGMAKNKGQYICPGYSLSK